MNANARTERTLPLQTSQLDPNLALLAELIGLLQMHRGASLAALGGVESFHQQAAGLHPQIDTLLAKIAYSAMQADPAQWQLINSEWQNTRKHWRQDTPLSNFEIHNFLIEQCHRLLWRQVEALRPGPCTDTEAFLFRDIPTHIEGLGQLRGLASYALAQKADPAIVEGCRARVVQLSKQAHLSLIETQRKLIRLATEKSSQALLPALQARVRLSGQFLQGIQDQIIQHRTAPDNRSPEKLFHLGTLAIEANQRVWNDLARQAAS